MDDSEPDLVDANLAHAAGGYPGSQRARLPEEIVENEYNFNHPNRGYAIIINNRKFEHHTEMPERNGTDLDAAALYQRLSALDFKVELVNNLRREEMRSKLEEVAKRNHSDNDCVVVAILTHGEEGVVYGVDGWIELEKLVAPFKGDKCLTLVGKPKIFFVQACRGNKLDHGVEVCDAEVVKDEPDAATVFRVPSEADFLMAYSVVPGYFSWRNSTNGSWFIQSLCKVLEKFGHTLDIMTMMTRVNRMVAFDYESNANKEYMSKKKQIPCITSMLTKDLYFRPKLPGRH
ncbi:caspase-3 [Lingula anatina]|uniref:Caspase-3 n=1 Tax=Lingula anatina TaxID=7574 RepID=A0A1S3IQF8_LINAN|nr:caspase-3 [Lingula anatina]|eukprot:XP_013399774.1 caspase-3 [Lingula anatina]